MLTKPRPRKPKGERSFGATGVPLETGPNVPIDGVDQLPDLIVETLRTRENLPPNLERVANARIENAIAELRRRKQCKREGTLTAHSAPPADDFED